MQSRPTCWSSAPAAPACMRRSRRRAAAPRVLLADRSLIGRGGATVMAQMTVAVGARRGDARPLAASSRTTPSRPAAGCATKRSRGCCARKAPDCIREMDAWGVGWARQDGHITRRCAPGHDRPRCVYVDFLNTGPAVSKTLRTRGQHAPPASARPATSASSISYRTTARSPAPWRCISAAARRSSSRPRRRSSRPAA